MEIKKKRPKQDSILTRYTVPVPESMKLTLDKIKSEQQVDVNAMTREFFELLILETAGNQSLADQ